MWRINRSKILCFAVFAVGMFSGCACSSDSNSSEPPATPLPRQVRVATWNVHNFFDTVCDSGACGVDDYEPAVSQAEYDAKVNAVASGVKFINTDVMLLQEIENDKCFNDLVLALGDEYKGAVFGEQGRSASMDVGIVTRGTISSVKKYRDDHPITQTDGSTKLLARELLGAEITLPNGVEMTAFTTHFVSKATDPVGDRRQGEATLTQQLLADYMREHPNRLIVFGGDLNDTPDSEQIQTLSKDGLLVSATKKMPADEITTWRNSSAFDHLFYPAEYESYLKDTIIICDEQRYNGFKNSDHCSVKTTLLLPAVE